MLNIMGVRVKNIFALMYGCWIAIAYLAVKLLAPNSMMETFAVGSLLGGFGISGFYKNDLLAVIKQPIAWLRAICFGLTQVFLFYALKNGDLTASFSASSTAVLFALGFSNFFLKEERARNEITAALFSVLGIWMIAPDLKVSLYGAIAGLFQALSVITARRAHASSSSLIGNVALGLLLGGLLSALVCQFQVASVFQKPLIPLFVATLTILSQLFFVWISFSFSSVTANQIGQTRIIWALLLEGAASFKMPPFPTAIGAIIVCASALISTLQMGKKSLLK